MCNSRIKGDLDILGKETKKSIGIKRKSLATKKHGTMVIEW
jgi:hypothetical protein